MEQKNNYEGFTLALALVDALPVLLFGASSIVIGMLFKSTLFIVGACLCFVAGFLKVLWKILLATKKKDIPILSKQMKYTMMCGFALIIVSVLVGIKRISLAAVVAAVTGLPQVIFFALWLVGMSCMGVLAKKLDGSVAKNNWIEQCTNATAQLCFFIGLLIIL